jgi:hypothetical protein
MQIKWHSPNVKSSNLLLNFWALLVSDVIIAIESTYLLIARKVRKDDFAGFSESKRGLTYTNLMLIEQNQREGEQD